MKKLKEKWGIKSNFQLVIILIVFAITGSTSAAISGPTTDFLFGEIEMNGFLKFILQLVIIMPIYQVLLLFFGFVFFQFNFFFKFVKKFLKLFGLGFLFLIDKKLVVDDLNTLLKGVNLVSDFLEKTILKPNNLNYPISRTHFINTLK